MDLEPFLPSHEMTFATVKADFKRLRQYYSSLIEIEADKVCIDLGHVTRCDSAGLALLIEAQKLSKVHNKLCTIIGLSKAIYALADLCGVNHFLITTSNEQYDKS